MSESPAAPSGNVIVSAERLAELERLERETMEKKKQSIEKLKQYEKENPELHRSDLRRIIPTIKRKY